MFYIKSILSLATLLILSGCGSEKTPDYVLFSGTIQNPRGEKAFVSGSDFSHELQVKEDGTFSDTLRVTQGYYSFSHAEMTTIFLTPGDSLHLDMDTAQYDESLVYSGTGAVANNYLAKKYLEKEKLTGDYKALYLLDEAAYVKKNQDIKEACTLLLENLKATDPEFVEIETKNLNYEYLGMLKYYESSHAYYAEDADFKAQDFVTAPLKEVDFDNDADYITFSSYKSLVTSEMMDYNTLMNHPETLAAVIARIKGLKSENIRNGLAKALGGYLSPSYEGVQEIYSGAMEISTNDEEKAELTEKYNRISKLFKGQPAPKFDYVNYAGGKTSMDDLAGKYVYFDIWATWCGPCIREIPYLKEVEEKYHDANVQFVSVSIDRLDDFEKWKTFIAEKDLGGIQLYADGDWKSSIITDYAIDGIPRFILVDPSGNIVNADAPRPSNPALVELLDGLVF